LSRQVCNLPVVLGTLQTGRLKGITLIRLNEGSPREPAKGISAYALSGCDGRRSGANLFEIDERRWRRQSVPTDACQPRASYPIMSWNPKKSKNIRNSAYASFAGYQQSLSAGSSSGSVFGNFLQVLERPLKSSLRHAHHATQYRKTER